MNRFAIRATTNAFPIARFLSSGNAPFKGFSVSQLLEKPKPVNPKLMPTQFAYKPTAQSHTDLLKSTIRKETPKVLHMLHVTSSRNNTILTFTTPTGDCIAWSSAGTVGLKKAKRGNADAAVQACISLVEKVKAKNVAMDGVHLKLRGFGPGREQIFRTIRGLDWKVLRVR
jgi:ribosomal protein S11